MARNRIKGITIEIEGNTTSLQKSLSEVDKSLSRTQNSLKDVDRLLKLDPGNTELLAQKQAGLVTAIDGTKERLKQLKEITKDSVSAEEWDAIQREIVATEGKLESLENEYKNFGSVGAQQVAAVGEKLKDVGSKMQDVGKDLSVKVTAPVVAGFTAAVKTTADFDSAMSDVAATMGVTTDEIAVLRDKAKEMGATTSFSATEAAQGLNVLAMSGMTAEEQIAGIKPVLDLAAAGSIDMAEAASFAMGAVKGFGDEVGNAQYYTDIMAKGATLANTDVRGLGEALSGTAATANGYGQAADGVTVALLRLAEQNVTGTEATTALNRAMADLYTPTDAAAAALMELGVSAYDEAGNARELNTVMDELSAALGGMSDEQQNAYKDTIFTAQGLQAFNKITAASQETVEGFWAGVGDASGSASEQSQTKLNNLSGQLTILKSGVEGLAISVGETLMPYVSKAVEVVQDLTDKFNSLDDSQKETVVKIAAVAAAIGPVLIVVGTLASAIGSVMSVVGAVGGAITGIMSVGATLVPGIGAVVAALGPVALVIGAVIAAGVLLWKNWDKIKEFASSLKDGVVNAFNSLKTGVSNAFNSLKTGVSNAWNGIKTVVGGAVDGVKTKVSNDFNSLKTDVGNTWNGIKTVVGGAVDGVKTKVSNDFNSLKTDVGNTWNGIKSAMSTPIESAKNLVSNGVSAIKNMFPIRLGNIFSGIKLPHFKISGGSIPWGIGGKGKKPSISIDWYRRAYSNPVMFTSPTVLPTLGGLKGFGDSAGGEIVLSDKKLREIAGGGATYNINVYATPGMDVKQLADEVQMRLAQLERQKEAAYA